MYQSVILLCVYPELICMFALQSSVMNITYTFQNLGIFSPAYRRTLETGVSVTDDVM